MKATPPQTTPVVVMGGGCDKCDKNKKGANAANTVAGAAAAGVASNSDHLANNYKAKYGTREVSASDRTTQTRNRMRKTERVARGAGTGTSILGAVLGLYNFNDSDKSWGDIAELGVSFLSAGLTCGTATAPVGIGIGFIDL